MELCSAGCPYSVGPSVLTIRSSELLEREGVGVGGCVSDIPIFCPRLIK
jgi:hypothetical protein